MLDLTRAVQAVKAAGVSAGEAAEAMRGLGMSAAQMESAMRSFAVACNQELIERLRKRFYIGAHRSDWDVLVITNGTFARASIELGMRWRAFWREVFK